MKTGYVVLASVLLSLLMPAAAKAQAAAPVEAPAESSVLAITGATLIDGTGGTPLRGAALLMEDGRITAVGSQASMTFPDTARVIDASGKYIIPGLMDANLHLYLNRDLESLIKYEGRYHEIIVEAAQIALKTGLTTVFDTWGPRAPLVQARDAINAGEVPGARIYLAGNIIGYGGLFSTDFNAAAAAFVSKAFARRLDAMWEQGTGQHLLWATPEEVRAAVREYATLDVDFLKYGASGHALHEMRFISFSPRVQKIIVEEGHRAGLTVQAHTSTTESLDQAIEAGVDILTHCDVSGADTVLADEVIAKIARRGIPCSIIPITQRRLDAMNAADANDWLPRYSTQMKDNQRRMIEAGVTLLVSTDAGITNPQLAAEASGVAAVQVDARSTLGEGHFNALVALQEMGMEPMAILQAVTRNTAAAYKKDKDMGTLETGKMADLVILNRNPLEDARHYRDIHAVIKSGAVVDIDALPLAPLISSMVVE